MNRDRLDLDVMARRTALGILAATAITTAGCGGLLPDHADPPAKQGSGKSGTKSPASKPLQFAVIPKGTTHEFWKSVHAGSLQAAEEFAPIKILWQGPNKEEDTARQIEIVKNMITRGVDGIILAPNHSEALVDAVKEAEAAGIPTVIFDSGLGKGANIVSYVATDNFRGGELAAETMAKALGEKGNVIMLRYKEGSESTEQREEGFLKKIAEFTNIKVLSSDQYAGTSVQQALEKASQVLLRYQDEVNGIFGVCESNCDGILEALEQSGLAGKVKFVAFDPSDRLINGLKVKKVDGIVLQNPLRMGYESVRILAEKIRGGEVPANQSTGEFVATPDNMETDEMKKLLHPPVAEGDTVKG